MDITLNDVKQFINTLGYTWNGDVFIDTDFVKAENFNQLNSTEPQSIILHHGRKKEYMSVIIDEAHFKSYNYYYDFGDIDDPCFKLADDYSDQWQKFLFNKYGKQYQQHLLSYSKSNKERIIANLVKEINRLKQERHAVSINAKNEIEKYNNLEKIANAYQSDNLKK